MSTLSKNDLSVIEGDARVSDRRLSEALGFSRVTDFRRLMRSKMDELLEFGEVLRFEALNPSPKGGRPVLTLHFNEHQAVALAMWAETPQARAARRQIIEVFVAWRRGDQHKLEVLRGKPDPFKATADRTAAVLAHLNNLDAMQDLVMRLTHLPIWKNGRRPVWWSDLEVREFLTLTHRQITLKEVVSVCRSRFGDRAPSMSSVNRYWMQLDTVVGPSGRAAGLLS